MGRLQLFDDGGDSSAGGEDDLSKIEIDHEFARRYEHNKKREELQKYEELKKQGRVDSDSDESSSEEVELFKPSKETDIQFFDALIKVKNQDPVLRNNDAKLFNSDSEDDDGSDSAIEEKGKDKKKKKPMYLKDVVSKHLIEEGPEFDDEEMENVDNDGNQNRLKSYSEEQDELRKEFLKAVEAEEEGDIDAGGDFIRVKNSGMENEEEEEDDEIGGKLDEYFGEDEKLDENTMFLKDFFRKKMWMDDTSKNTKNFDDIELSEDEEEVERQEDYEREFNFRFEENAGDRVMGYSRKVEGSVRKKDNARKVQRERKEERMVQAEFERKEELKRLKNLKKKEINEKLQKIRDVAGITEEGKNIFLDEDDLEEEFDPEAHDRKMNTAFDDRYYDAKDVDPQFGSDEDEDEKPVFDKDLDELLGLPKGWDEANESRDGFTSARQRILKDRVVGDEYDDENEISEDGDGELKEGKRKRKRKPSEVEKAVREELMEEYYKLDYEDTIGDLKTRFKYKPVKAKRYGLTPVEIFAIDEKELNQYVSLKKLAPYVEKEWKVPRIKTTQLKQKAWEVLKGKTSNSVRGGRKEKRGDVNALESKRSQPEESNGETSDKCETSNDLSRRSKRRRRQAELKLPLTRLIAYGKIRPKSKSKSKK